MKYLVTGGCGFVGCNLAALLLSKGHAVTVFDSFARAGAESNLAWLKDRGALESIKGDTRNTNEIEAAIRAGSFSAIFHLAGQVAMTTSMQNPRQDFEINVGGTLNILESVRQFSPQTSVVYASSNKVYGELTWLELSERDTRYTPKSGATGVDESAPLDFQTPYGCSKGAADQYMLDYARCFGLNTVVFRHSSIYGGRQFSTYDQGWVGWFCRQALEIQRDPLRKPFTISGDGKQVRDLLHATDAARCYLAAAENIVRTRGQAFNIGGGHANSLSLLELFAHLEEKLGVKMRFDKLPWRPRDQKYFVADAAKAQRLFGWTPQVTKEAGIDEALAWEKSRLS